MVNFMKKAVYQLSVFFGVILFFVFLIVILQQPVTTKSPRGTVKLFCQQMKAENLPEMQKYCEGTAVPMAKKVLDAIDRAVETHKASPLDMILTRIGAGEGKDIVHAKAILKGVSGDSFMEVFINLRKKTDGTWIINGLGWEDLYEKDK